jgi:hypothetical protein
MVSAFEGNPSPINTDLEKCIEIAEDDDSYGENVHRVFAGRLYD